MVVVIRIIIIHITIYNNVKVLGQHTSRNPCLQGGAKSNYLWVQPFNALAVIFNALAVIFNGS